MAEGIKFLKRMEDRSEYEIWDLAVFDLRKAVERIERMEKIKVSERVRTNTINDFLAKYEKLKEIEPPEMVMETQYHNMMDIIEKFMVEYRKDPRKAMMIWYSSMLRATDDFMVAYYG